VELALPHLELAEEAIISFGQGCEGEPSLQYPLLKEVIGEIRSKTKAGTININTNAGDAVAIKTICEAGLDSMRVSLFSARPEQYNRYHQGRYQLEEVETSLKIAGQFGVYRSLNLLVYPGVTDREEEVEALVDFLARTEIEMIQLRNLNIDPDFLQEKILPQEGELLGIPLLIEILKEEFPQLRIGNYSRPKNK
jgi:pyruvate-formate lyase-activating enzyme